MAEHPPTFILGCVRSGTTLLRNLLRRHPGTFCPEETQYYRWGHPYRTEGYTRLVARGGVLARHRALDGIEEGDFREAYDRADGRAGLMRAHMGLVADANGHETGGGGWFDKSPQNVYGLPLILHDFPDARIVHITRNPLNVVASLLEGVIVAVPDTVAAANYWFEAVAIVNTLKPLMGDRLLELRYEDLTEDPDGSVARVLSHMGLDPDGLQGPRIAVHPERDRQTRVLKPDDHRIIRRICGRWARTYGYDLAPLEETAVLSEA